jgi:hypothetical protein
MSNRLIAQIYFVFSGSYIPAIARARNEVVKISTQTENTGNQYLFRPVKVSYPFG